MTLLKRGLILLGALLAVGLAVYAAWPQAQPDQPVSESAPDAAAAGTPEAAPAASQQAQAESQPADESRELQRRAQELGETRQSELRELRVTEERFPHDVRMDDYKAALWSEIQANPPRFETPGDPALDGETAYRLYMYYGMCTMAPRTGQQVDRYLERMAERAGRSRGSRLDFLENRADWMVDMYELCLAIPPEVDARMEAVIWMSEAVRLGHEIAEVQFYEKAMGFMLRPDPYFNDPPLVLQHPELIGEFKATASQALTRAVEKGHPEAWLAMSRAVADGVVFTEDPVSALAYARVAEREAMKNHVILVGLDDQVEALTQHLDRDQIAEADELAHRLVTSS